MEMGVWFMARRSYTQPARRSVASIVQFHRWKSLLIIVPLIVLLIPTYRYLVDGFNFAVNAGSNVFPALSNFFYVMGDPKKDDTAETKPRPPFPYPAVLPVAGTITYTVAEGDSCNSVLTYQMNMNQAGTIFSDSKPETVAILNKAIGQDCHKLQPGMKLRLAPQYPLVALGGVVKKVELAATPQEKAVPTPTPLITIPKGATASDDEEEKKPDCAEGCKLTVQVGKQSQDTVTVFVYSSLTVEEGAWVWVQGQFVRQTVKNFPNYPYAQPGVTARNYLLQACYFQVDDQLDPDVRRCRSLEPNTIEDDGGSWLLAVGGAGGLNHWKYPVKVPDNTPVLLWLSSTDDGKLEYKPGNPIYRYEDNGQYVPFK
jgi:hypothetical protein